MSSASLRQYDPKLLNQVKEIILKHARPSRVYLFGSRVTGDAQPASDYDFAYELAESEGNVLLAIREEIESLNTLHRIDVADITHAEARFANRVRDTGLVIFSATKALRAEDGLIYFSRALDRFRIIVAERERWIREGNGDIVLDVAAKRFEFTYEMAWKALKRLLDYLGIDARAPRPVFKEAFIQGLLEDEEVWLDMIEMRYLSSHVYDEHEISRILTQLERYLAAFENLREKIESCLKSSA